MNRAFLPLVIFFFFLAACGGGSEEPSITSTAAQEEATSGDESAGASEANRTPQPSATIDRAALGLVLEAGLGRFLQGVETEPALEEGRFVGFRLLSLYPDDPRMADVGLEHGDVITKVNGQPIERPEQALHVWDGLRVASELVIEYRRGDQARELRFAIVD